MPKISIAMMLLLLAACGGRVEEEAPAPVAEAAAVPTSSAQPAEPFSIRGSDGKEALSIRETPEEVVVTYLEGGASRTLRGDWRDSGKRKYTIDGGAVLYEVKPGDDGGFKLRRADGSLLWKVKVTDEKIKISNNEGNDNPFELKTRDAGRFKVVAPDGSEIGNVRFDAASRRVEVERSSGEKQLEITTDQSSSAYGVLLLDAIPQPERMILFTELFSRGR